MVEHLRNIAIIAHVDHGKTTLVDQLLRQSQTLEAREEIAERAMDSNPLERERGITILSKNTAIRWGEYRINIVDTPGHADFGGEVERVLSMVDSVLLIVDAVDGPMPQTRFVTRKAFDHGLKPIVVINKVDREGARPHVAVEATFDLMDSLGASDEQLDFPIIFASALLGQSGHDPSHLGPDMTPLFQAIVDHCPAPDVEDADGPLQLQVSALDYSSYVGAIGIGRIKRGVLRRNSPVAVVSADGEIASERVGQVFGFLGLKRVEVDSARAGDIVAFSGIDHPRISDTLCDPDQPDPLPALTVDQPTIQMSFETNDSPFAGRDGKFLTSRQLRERLMREAIHNVALRVADTGDPERFDVSGRGELHLSVLLETMRREGYELAVSRPHVIVRETDSGPEEPWELVAVDIESRHQGAIMEALGERGGELLDMRPDGAGRVRLDYRVPSRGLIGFQSEFRSATSGTGLLHHVFDHYGPVRAGALAQRSNGVLISNGTGKALAYALFNLQERGRLMVGPGEDVYEGQVVGIHSRDNDLTVNPMKAKQLTNIRAAGKDDNVLLSAPVKLTLEQALEFIDDDELVEITPSAIRIRKKHLKEHERKRAARAG
ncbi:MAG: translational GTPase TypA [Gammaproteobacteria bacterium]